MDERKLLATLEQSLSPASAVRLTVDERKLLAAIEQKVNSGTSQLTVDERRLLTAIVGAGAVGDERELLAQWLGSGGGDERELLQGLVAVATTPSGLLLPQNLQLVAGTLYEDFETAGDWTAASGTVAANTTAGQFKTGTQSLKHTTNAGANSTITKTVNWDLSGSWNRMLLWMYLHNPVLTDYGGSTMLMLSNDSGFSNYYRAWLSAANTKTAGWQTLTFHKNHFGTVGAPSWSNPIIRVRLQTVGAATKQAAVSFDSLMFGLQSRAGVLLSFDDGYLSQYADCFAYMQAAGIRGTLWFQTNTVALSAAQLLEMDAAGWTIGNHTNASTSLPTLTEAQQEAQILGGKTALAVMGLSKGNNYLAYPGGNSNADTLTACNNLGVLLARNTVLTTALGEPTLAMPLGGGFALQLPSNGITDATAVATVQGLIDRAIVGGYLMPLHFHNVGAAGNMTLANFKLVIDYIRAQKTAGVLVDVTAHDLYQLQCGPVTILP